MVRNDQRVAYPSMEVKWHWPLTSLRELTSQSSPTWFYALCMLFNFASPNCLSRFTPTPDHNIVSSFTTITMCTTNTALFTPLRHIVTFCADCFEIELGPLPFLPTRRAWRCASVTFSYTRLTQCSIFLYRTGYVGLYWDNKETVAIIIGTVFAGSLGRMLPTRHMLRSRTKRFSQSMLFLGLTSILLTLQRGIEKCE
jgi:hypothetical protein